MTSLLPIILSIAVIAAVIIGAAGAFIVVKRPAERKKGLLMVAVAAVTLANVWLLSAPLP